MSTSTEQAKDYPPTTPPSHKRPPVVVLLWTVGILIVLLGGSMFWMWQGSSGTQPGAVKPGATATVTAQPTWIPTPITPPAGSVFYDTFINNSHGWSLSPDNGYLRIMVNNSLILATTTSLIESVPTSLTLSDYVISTDFTINQINDFSSVGLYLRGDSNLDHDYRIEINGDNTFDVAKEWLDTSSSQMVAKTTMLVAPHYTTLLHSPGQQNTLSVTMIGQIIVVSINNLVAATVSDSAYTSGQIALFAHNSGNADGVTVSFTRVEIDRLAQPWQTPVPTPTLQPTPTSAS